jgi:serine/threonine protein phosphatase 1
LTPKISSWTHSRVPEGERLYAIGDIHGRADLLDRILSAITTDNKGRAEAAARLIFLGDYVDRGPASKQVVDRLIHGLPEGFEATLLKGNHEDLLVSFLREPLEGMNWLENGGDATLVSYGVPPRLVHEAFMKPEALLEAARLFAGLLPEDHRLFYETLAVSFQAGDYFFVHAGVKPGVPLDRQIEDDLLWIRDDFLNWPYDFGAVVVHGHTPVRFPEDKRNRVGIDTYAFASGKLTAAGFENAERRFLST